MDILKSINWSSFMFNLQLIIASAAVITIAFKCITFVYTKIKKGYLNIKTEYDKICIIHTMIPSIYSELTPNHGSSIKDKIDKIDKKVDENTKVTNLICHRQRWILDNRSEPIFESDANGNCTWVNEKYCQLTKHNISHFIGNGWKSMIHEDDRERVIQEWESAVEDKRSSTCTYRIVDVDGNIYHISAISTINDIYGYIGTITILNKESD